MHAVSATACLSASSCTEPEASITTLATGLKACQPGICGPVMPERRERRMNVTSSRSAAAAATPMPLRNTVVQSTRAAGGSTRRANTSPLPEPTASVLACATVFSHFSCMSRATVSLMVIVMLPLASVLTQMSPLATASA